MTIYPPGLKASGLAKDRNDGALCSDGRMVEIEELGGEVPVCRLQERPEPRWSNQVE